MGCGTSSRRISILSSNNADHSERSSGRPKAMSIQDEARSFRSKVGAIKMLTRNDASYQSFLEYLQDKGKSEFLICYRDMEEIKILAEDQMISRTAALIWRYKSIFESVRIHGVKPDTMEYLIWECFGKLRQMDIANAPADLILKHLLIAQNEILARLVIPFESYLQSPQYRAWQDKLIELEKQRRLQQSQQQQQQGNKTISSRLEPCSANYPHILIVDDSSVTLKITGLTLERDGHHVDRASNGQIALEIMKSRSYDVVLIDCNMPVMDGFEAVRLFREYEQGKKEDLLLEREDDVSSISVSDDGKPREKTSPTAKIARDREREEKKAANSSSNSNKYLNPPLIVNNDSNTSEENPGRPDSVLDERNLTRDESLRKSLTAEHYHQLIIGMSTCIDEDTRSRALAAGMDYFLPKPFTLEKFIETIRNSRDFKKARSQKKTSFDNQSIAAKSTNEMTVKTTVTASSTTSASQIHIQTGGLSTISSFTHAIGQALSPKNQRQRQQQQQQQPQNNAIAETNDNQIASSSAGNGEIPLPAVQSAPAE